DQRHALFQSRLGQAAAFDAHAIGVAGTLDRLVTGISADFEDLHRDAGIGKAQGDADTHGAATDDTGGLDVAYRGVLGQTVNLGSQALGEESVYQRGALRRYHAFGEQLALALEAFSQRQGEGSFNGGYAALWREHAGCLLLDFGAFGGNSGGIVHAFQLVGTLASAAGALAFGNELFSEGQTGGQQFAVEQLVHHTQFVGFHGSDRRTADDHVQSLGHTNHTRQTLGTTGARQQAEFDFRQADLGVLAGDTIMAAQSDFQTTTQGGTVDHGDARLAAGLDAADHVRQAWRLRWLAEFLDVGAGDEGIAFADQHDGLDLSIGLGSVEAVLQTFTDRHAQSVDRRIVDSDNGNGALPFQCDHVRHAESPVNQISFIVRNNETTFRMAKYKTYCVLSMPVDKWCAITPVDDYTPSRWISPARMASLCANWLFSLSSDTR